MARVDGFEMLLCLEDEGLGCFYEMEGSGGREFKILWRSRLMGLCLGVPRKHFIPDGCAARKTEGFIFYIEGTRSIYIGKSFMEHVISQDIQQVPVEKELLVIGKACIGRGFLLKGQRVDEREEVFLYLVLFMELLQRVLQIADFFDKHFFSWGRVVK